MFHNSDDIIRKFFWQNFRKIRQDINLGNFYPMKFWNNLPNINHNLLIRYKYYNYLYRQRTYPIMRQCRIQRNKNSRIQRIDLKPVKRIALCIRCSLFLDRPCIQHSCHNIGCSHDWLDVQNRIRDREPVCKHHSTKVSLSIGNLGIRANPEFGQNPLDNLNSI
jgi:hypothetical protein